MASKLFYELQARSLSSLLFRRQSIITGYSNNKIYPDGKRHTHSTIASKDYFYNNKDVLWDRDGPLRPIYLLNNIRVPYIRDILTNGEHVGKYSTCLEGLKILDVGCGGGYLSEALAQLGAEVTGIDVNKEGIEFAQRYSLSSKNKKITNKLPTYKVTAIEEFCKDHAESYDVVIASEVVDHVAQQELFVQSCVRSAKPGGRLFFTTINRTHAAQFIIIFVFENIIRAIPKGAHKFDMFIKPSELQYMLEMNDCLVQSTRGYFYYPFSQHWDWIKNKQFFFAIDAVKSH